MSFNPSSLPDLKTRVYIVTGATSGIGYYTAANLAQHNAHVYICARSSAKGDATITSIKSIHPYANLSVLVMDHTRMSTVVTAAKDFLSKESRLDGLVNNAGIMATPFAMTEDGYEEQWQTNYLAHWVFTRHLLPLMLATSQRAKQEGLPDGGVRLVNLTSIGHQFVGSGGINLEDTTREDATGLQRYGQSKLANILHMRTLHKAHGPSSTSDGSIWTSAIHPGLVKTSLDVRAQVSGWWKAPMVLVDWFGGMMDADKGSWTSVFCVASPDMKKEDCGKYFQRIADPNGWQSSMAKDEKLAEKLEEWTQQEMQKAGWI